MIKKQNIYIVDYTYQKKKEKKCKNAKNVVVISKDGKYVLYVTKFQMTDNNKTKCPKCEDLNIYMLGLDFFECANCGYQWKEEDGTDNIKQ